MENSVWLGICCLHDLLFFIHYIILFSYSVHQFNPQYLCRVCHIASATVLILLVFTPTLLQCQQYSFSVTLYCEIGFQFNIAILVFRGKKSHQILWFDW